MVSLKFLCLAVVTVSLVGTVFDVLVFRYLLRKKLDAVRRHERNATWKDCIRFHQFQDR